MADQPGRTAVAVLQGRPARDRDGGRGGVGRGDVRVVAAEDAHLLPLPGLRQGEGAVPGEDQRAGAAHGERALAAEDAVVRRRPRRHGDDRVAAECHVPVGADVGGDVPAGGGRRGSGNGQGGDGCQGTDGRCCLVGMAAHVMGTGGAGRR
ncbi:hypothetical protein ACFZAV_32370 [Streptomyces sp. NPDC008343]|uniref:hypothetical protein n=1 Tax=Streptomyces sp. NPDC008343 TaxID=3364828 RepID=UPI0036E664C5